jgi:ribosomal 30S subunit maturation factor RimM
MTTPSSEKYDAAFKVAKIVGSCGIEGIKVSESTKKQMACIIDGTLSASDAKEAILTQYRKFPR